MGFLSNVADFGKNLLTGGAGKAAEGYQEGANQIANYYNQAYGDLSPYREFGKQQMGDFSNWLKAGSPMTESPAYKFRMDQGIKSLDNSAIGRGGLRSGNYMRDLMGYSQGLASQEFDNEYNRRFGRAGFGMGAATAGGNMAMGAGNSIAQMMAGKGQAQAQGYQFPLTLGASFLGGYLGK